MATGINLLILIVLFISTAAAVEYYKYTSQSCPPDDVICPCTCYEAGIAANLQCIGLKDQATLTNVLDQSDKYECKGFDLVESNVSFIPASIFNAQKPIKINIITSTLVSLFERPPSVNNTLKIMLMNHVTLSNGFQWEMFSRFKMLDFLTIMNMFIGKIGRSFSTHAPKGIGMLAFYNCSVSELDDFAFASLMNLTELYIQYGSIKELKRSTFPNPSQLEKLVFKGHRIGHLPEDIFSNMPNLKGIDLSENVLAAFSETTFGSVYPNLQFMEVDENPIICSCDISWITTVISKYEWFRIDGTCSEPKELKGRFLSDLKIEDFSHCH